MLTKGTILLPPPLQGSGPRQARTQATSLLTQTTPVPQIPSRISASTPRHRRRMLLQHLLEIAPRVAGGVLGRSMTTVTHKPTFRTPDEDLEEALDHLYRHLKQEKVL